MSIISDSMEETFSKKIVEFKQVLDRYAVNPNLHAADPEGLIAILTQKFDAIFLPPHPYQGFVPKDKACQT